MALQVAQVAGEQLALPALMNAGFAGMTNGMCVIAGAFAAGYATSELKSRTCRKRKTVEQLEADVEEVKRKVSRQGTQLRVSTAKARGQLQAHSAMLASKADATKMADRLNAKLNAKELDPLLTDRVEGVRSAAVGLASGGSLPRTPSHDAARRDLHEVSSSSGEMAAQALPSRASLSNTAYDPSRVDAQPVAGVNAALGTAFNYRGQSNQAARDDIQPEVREVASGSAGTPKGHGNDREARDMPGSPGRPPSQPRSEVAQAAPLDLTRAASDDRAPASRKTDKLLQEHPNRIPIVCTPAVPHEGPADELKLLAAQGMTGGQLRAAVLKRLQRNGGGSQGVVLFVGGTELGDSVAVADVYALSKSGDGLLNLTYAA